MTSLRRSAVALALLVLVGCAGAADPRISSAQEIRTLLVGGKWLRHLDEKQFFADRTYDASDPARRTNPIHGTWRLDGHSLRLTERNETTDYQIIAISHTDLEMTFGTAGQRLHYRRAPRLPQANGYSS